MSTYVAETLLACCSAIVTMVFSLLYFVSSRALFQTVEALIQLGADVNAVAKVSQAPHHLSELYLAAHRVTMILHCLFLFAG